MLLTKYTVENLKKNLPSVSLDRSSVSCHKCLAWECYSHDMPWAHADHTQWPVNV